MGASVAAVAGGERLETGVGSILDALAGEMDLAGAACLKLDALVGEIMAALPPGQRAQMTEGLHLVDLLSQQLHGLSAFARRMGGVIGDGVRAPAGEALAELTLGALAGRMTQALGGEAMAEAEAADDGDAGDLDLF